MTALLHYLASTGRYVDRGTLWAFLTCIFTGLAVCIAWWQLRGIQKTGRAEFLYKFDRDFFKPETRELMILVDYRALKFKIKQISYLGNNKQKEYPYFEVDREIQRNLIGVEGKEKYSAFEVEENLLGFFEGLGIQLKEKIVKIKYIDDTFGWYLIRTWENEDIHAYIEQQRKAEGNATYREFERLYDILKSR